MFELDDEAAARGDLERIIDMQDAVLRNLLITQRYHDLSRGLAGILGEDNVNWSTFATWASKTAGQSIRNEEIPSSILVLLDRASELDRAVDWVKQRLFGSTDARGLERADVIERIRRTVADVSGVIAEGNLKVFRELAPEFLRAYHVFREDTAYYAPTIESFVSRFRAGPAADGGQDLLRAAFRHYYEARFTPDSKKKAQLVLLANGEVGLHEQTRLQPNIKDALDAPVEDLLAGHMHDHLAQAGAAPAREDLDPLLTAVAGAWRQAATHFLMKLALPGNARLSLGEDVPPLSPLEAFPEPLRALSLPELLEFAAHYLVTLDSDEGTAAHDWANLEQRMDFILDLFRSRQQTRDLLGQPFSDTQWQDIERGVVPPGPLY